MYTERKEERIEGSKLEIKQKERKKSEVDKKYSAAQEERKEENENVKKE